jgi:hypothetical protein
MATRQSASLNDQADGVVIILLISKVSTISSWHLGHSNVRLSWSGFSGSIEAFVGYGYGYGHRGVGLIGTILIIIVILTLIGRI